MKKITMFVFAALFLTAQFAFTQPHGRENPERFQRFRKMKLIEVLKLNEDEAARFVAKENVHQENVRNILNQRNDILDDIRKSLKDDGDKPDVKNLDKQTNDVLAFDEQLFKERRRYHDELRSFFAPDKFAKYLVFEREFGREVGNAIRGMGAKRDRWRDE